MAGRKTKTTARSGLPSRSTAQFVATAAGLGRCPLAPGTMGSVVGAAVGLPFLGAGWPLQVGAVAVLVAVAVAVAGRAAEQLGRRDPPEVVIDEVAGMCVAMLWLPFRLYDLCAVFLLFRLFDVVKPAPIPRLERLPGGMGIVADDVAEGLLARATWWLLQVNFDFL